MDGRVEGSSGAGRGERPARDPLDPGDRGPAKRDRLARLLRVLGIVQANADQGVSAPEVARQTSMSLRSAYRDLKAIDQEIARLWNADGRWGLAGDGPFLPPLKLTLGEAVAVLLLARLGTRFADRHDPVLTSAIAKLVAGVPEPVRVHVAGTLRDLADRPSDPGYDRLVAALAAAWAERRVVRFRYRPAAYDGQDRAASIRTVHPYLLEPSFETRALYLVGHDESRGTTRTFKVDRIADLTTLDRRFEAETQAFLGAFRHAWDVIWDQPVTTVVLRFDPRVADRVMETCWHPTQVTELHSDGSLRWSATVAGDVEIRLWILSWGDEVEVLEPAELRADVAATHARAAGRYADAGAGAARVPVRRVAEGRGAGPERPSAGSRPLSPPLPGAPPVATVRSVVGGPPVATVRRTPGEGAGSAAPAPGPRGPARGGGGE